MLGEPNDVETECNARLFIADNYGDGTATIRCQLPLNHDGLHKEEFERRGHAVTITWVVDERERCDHGCGQWKHAHGRGGAEETVQCPKDADDHEYSDCAFCNPDEPPLTCEHCGKIHYYAEGHLRYCPQKPFTCATCGESGVGRHWSSDCPRQRELWNATPAQHPAEEPPP